MREATIPNAGDRLKVGASSRQSPATNGDAVYVFEIDPAVRGADYTVARILAEAFPAEAQSLYRRYADASSSRQHVVDLKLIAAFGDEAPR